MAFFNSSVAALLLSLSVAAVSSASAYTTIAASPAPAPATSSYEPGSFEYDYDPLNSYIIPRDEQDQDRQYLKAHMAAAADQVEIFLANEVEKRLNDQSTTDSDKGCLIVCREVYESAVDALKMGMESVSSREFVKASFDVSAFTTYIDTCNDCFADFQTFDDWAKTVGNDCLDKIVKYTNIY